ncbi:glycosyltransferase family 4 protein [Intrasporangium sp. YIM S08009]|uniref:glycosyltransferase family 4 protein n=1 Tax=Intrasporangium zincisolvens TaxID=3080018 RepID=UPI002B05D148|nr:glycosyltransferase family 4 protein [Intrasporangium sp. YIM S08009]
MRILLSSYQCLPDQGSELGNGWHWARALADCGHEVTVLTQPSHIIEAAAHPDIEFLHVGAPMPVVHRLSSTLGNTQHYLRWQDAALRYLETRPLRYDVAHHVSWGSLHLGSRLWQLPTPLVYGPIGGGQTAPSAYRGYFAGGWSSELLRTALTGPLLAANGRSRTTVRNAALTLVTNSATADACLRLGAGDVRYMLAEGLPGDWLGVPRSRPNGTPTVLWVGRMMPRKAPLLALQAFAALRRSVPARLVMAGDGPLLDRLRACVEEWGLGEEVSLPGRVPWADIKGLYDSASVFLFTSLRDSSGSQFLESLGRGLPAVALDHHGIGDLDVGSAAVKVALPPVPHELPGQLADALRTVLTGPDWDERSVAGVRWAAGHVWPAKAAAASRLYEHVLRTAPRQRA